jgi:hypothetical protein
MSPIGDILPADEAQARELIPLKSAELRQEAWTKAAGLSHSKNQAPTARAVRSIVKELTAEDYTDEAPKADDGEGQSDEHELEPVMSENSITAKIVGNKGVGGHKDSSFLTLQPSCCAYTHSSPARARIHGSGEHESAKITDGFARPLHFQASFSILPYPTHAQQTGELMSQCRSVSHEAHGPVRP